MTRWAALLRGANLGKRQPKSADLMRVAQECGFAEVRTVLASGNLLTRVAAIHDGPERLHAIGRELYIDYPGKEAMAASKLVSTMRRVKAPTVATARNWNTVTKLAAMLND